MQRDCGRTLTGAIAAIGLLWCAATADAGPRLDRIRRKGVVTCGVLPVVEGFSWRDAQGRYAGLDVDICRALSAAIFGTPDKVAFVQAAHVATFLQSQDIDVVSRRLTWELRREAPLGLLFGPIMFFDGQGFLVAKTAGAMTPRDLSGTAICVARGTPFDTAVGAYFARHHLDLQKVALESEDDFPAVRTALETHRCTAYTADVSQLGAIRSRMARPQDFDILAEQITKEPLAQLVRQDDAQFFDILRWTVFALVEAEELGVTAANVDEMRKSDRVEVQRLLGVVPGNGKALGLDERWAYNVIRTLGNYGELFEKNIGRGSPIGLDRGLNRLWTDGGVMYAPPLR